MDPLLDGLRISPLHLIYTLGLIAAAITAILYLLDRTVGRVWRAVKAFMDAVLSRLDGLERRVARIEKHLHIKEGDD